MTHALTTAIALVLLVPIASTAFPTDRMVVDDEWLTAPRTYEVHWDHLGFRAVGTAVDPAIGDTVLLRFDTTTHELRLEYTPSQEEGTEEPAPPVVLRIRFAALVEFEDHDRDLRYSLGDPVVHRTVLADASRPNVFSTETTQGRMVRVEYSLPQMFGARLGLEFTVPTVEGLPPEVPRTWFQMEARLTGYQFRSDNQTRLALEVRVSPGDILSPDAVGARNGLTYVFWTWDDTAAISDTPQHVGTTLQPYAAADRDETLVYLSHGRNTTWQHGMTLGVLRTEGPERPPLLQALGDWRIFLTGLVIAGLVVAVSVRHVMSRGD